MTKAISIQNILFIFGTNSLLDFYVDIVIIWYNSIEKHFMLLFTREWEKKVYANGNLGSAQFE